MRELVERDPDAVISLVEHAKLELMADDGIVAVSEESGDEVGMEAPPGRPYIAPPSGQSTPDAQSLLPRRTWPLARSALSKNTKSWRQP